MIILFFHSVSIVPYIYSFSYVTLFLHHRNGSHLVTFYDDFNIVEFSFLPFVGNFCISGHKVYWSVVFFSQSILVQLWYHVNVDLREWIKNFPSHLIFWKSLRRTGISSSLRCFTEFTCESIRSRAFLCCYVCDYQVNFLCFRSFQIFYFFMILSWPTSRICLLHLGYLICCHEIIHNILL
jgi:hypothetical protein